jgi:hypothetical protein
VVSTTSVKIIDNQKNVTEIPFVKLKDKPTKLKFVYNKIVRNGLEIEVPNTHIVYDWQEKKGVLTDLDTRVFVKGVEKYVFSYKKAQDKTVIKERSGNNVVTTTRSGFVPVTVQTAEGLLQIVY